jgi:protein PhnA
MSTIPPCPQCGSEYSYEDGTMFVCPECAHEWPQVDGDHDIDCKIDGIGAMSLKSEFVRKV